MLLPGIPLPEKSQKEHGLSKFKMNCHDLEIGRDRYDTKPKHFLERYCLSCLKDGLLVTEDEVHFFANCRHHKTRWKKLFEFVEAMYPSLNSLSDIDKVYEPRK